MSVCPQEGGRVGPINDSAGNQFVQNQIFASQNEYWCIKPRHLAWRATRERFTLIRTLGQKQVDANFKERIRWFIEDLDQFHATDVNYGRFALGPNLGRP